MRDYSKQANKFRQKAPKYPYAALGVTLFIVAIGGAAASLIWLNQSSDEQIVELPKPTPLNAVSAKTSRTKASINQTLDPIVENIPKATADFYTFYDLLLQNKVPIDVKAGEIRDKMVANKLKTTLIQVASFKSPQAAESERVKLLLLDLKARVIPPNEKNGGWYRIVLGPFHTIRDMNAAMDLLAKNGHKPQRRRD